MASKLDFLTARAHVLRKCFGLIILTAVAVMAGAIDPQALPRGEVEVTRAAAQESGLQGALPAPYPAPEFAGIAAWLGGKPLTMRELKGKVVLVDFWAYSCVNCVRTLPYMTQLDQKYRDKGLVLIGVHAPEFEFEKNKENVQAALAKRHIEYPVAMDNHLETWAAFKNLYWPAHYLIDSQGRVVYTHFGEGHYAEIEHNIRTLLGLNEPAEKTAEHVSVSDHQSPETYLGYSRAERFVSPEAVKVDEMQRYSLPAFIPNNSWALSGDWTVGPQHITSEKAEASLRYHFTAGKVFLVLGSKTGKSVSAKITLNGNPIGNLAGQDVKDGILTVNGHSLYELVNQKEIRDGLLEITAQSPGLEAYAFTFGL